MDARTGSTLGTLLRHLIEQLDSAVEEHYTHAGLAYRPRYTPIVRALLILRSASIKQIAQHAGLTHSAASQTVAQMTAARLVRQSPGDDARTRIISLTPRALAMTPLLEMLWETTNRAAAGLEAELPYPLSTLLQETIDALERESFFERIERTAREAKSGVSKSARTGADRHRTMTGRRQ